MSKASFRNRFKYYLQYVPITLNALALAAALWASYRWLLPYFSVEKKEAVASFAPLLLLIGKVILFFLLALLGSSVLSAVICWVHFLIIKRRGQVLDYQINPDTDAKGLWIESVLFKARRPILGFVKARLLYDDNQLTDTFLLASNKRNTRKLWRQGIAGKNLLELPDIKEYTIKGGFVFFEDMLHLFSIPVRINLQGHFHQTPKLVGINEQDAQPKKTQETNIRIEQLRRVEGEYLNYKDFESGDDVRRVVWKVYAKNRDLVVRVPEIFDPYASHLHMYASFYNKDFANNGFAAEMLNYYKNHIWSLYKALGNKEWAIKYLPDQPLNVAEQANSDVYVQHQISNSVWQSLTTLEDYFNVKTGTVICISSFNNPAEVANLVEQAGSGTLVYFVKLSEVFKTNIPLLWISRLLFLSPDDRLKKLRGRWFVHPMKWKLQKREQEIAQILEASNVDLLNSI